MGVVERSRDRLVIEDRRWRAAATLVAAAAAAGFVAGRQADHLWQGLIGPAFLLLLAWIAHFRALTTFDKQGGVVRHERQRVGWRTVKEYDSSAIDEIGLRSPPVSRHLHTWLIQVTMRNGDAFWLSPSSSRRRASLEELVDEIRAFAGLPAPMSLREHIRAMVRSGDTVGAVKLVRADEGLTLEAATRRVAEIAAS